MQLCTTYLLACIQVMKLACASRAAGVEERAKIPYYVMDFFFYADACCETDTQSPIPSLGFSFSSLSLSLSPSLAAVPWVERPRNGAAKMPHGGKTLRRLERPIGKLIEMAAAQFTIDSKACAMLVQHIAMNQSIWEVD